MKPKSGCRKYGDNDHSIDWYCWFKDWGTCVLLVQGGGDGVCET